jgi:isopenicillin-N epimerase
MMTPKGCAFLYARQTAQTLIKPIVVSWGDKSADSSAYVQELEFQGTTDFAAFLSISSAIEFMKRNDWDAVRERCHGLVNDYRRGMREIVGTPSLSPDDRRWYRQLSAHPLPQCDGAALQKTLFDDFGIEIPVTDGPDGKQYLRVSVQGYNTSEEITYLLDTVRDVLPRFLHPVGA